MRFGVEVRKLGLRDCRGQSLVEFALCVLVLIGLVFGVVDMSRMVLVYTTIANAARIGTRYAIVHGSHSAVTTTQIQTVVKSYLKAGTVNVTSANLNVTPKYPDSSCTSPGCRVSITVSYRYDPLTGYFPFLNVWLSSTSEGVITW